MSDPKIWNGTAWVRPRFWDGTSWLEYIDPIYDKPAASAEFATGLDGYTYAGTTGGTLTWNPGGWATTEGPGGFMQSFGFRCDAADLSFKGLQGHQLQLQSRYRFPGGVGGNMTLMGWDWQTSGFYPGITLAHSEDSLISDGQWHDLASPIKTMPEMFNIGSTRMGCSVYGGGVMDIDYTKVVDLTTGLTLMAVGNPLWEPRVWTGSQWR